MRIFPRLTQLVQNYSAMFFTLLFLFLENLESIIFNLIMFCSHILYLSLN